MRRTRHSTSAWLAACLVALAAAGSATADVALHDDFDGGALPLEGSASVGIERIGDQVTILWDDSPLLNGTLVPAEQKTWGAIKAIYQQ